MGIFCKLGWHKWEITAHSFFMRPLERKCDKCSQYEHKRDGRTMEWLSGKHPDSADSDFTEGHTSTI